jgi:hypothetical protein
VPAILVNEDDFLVKAVLLLQQGQNLPIEGLG